MKREFLKFRHKVVVLCVLTLSLMVACDNEDPLEVDGNTSTDAPAQQMPQEYLDMENKVAVLGENGEILSYFDEAGMEKNLKGEPINVGANGRTQNNGLFELAVFYRNRDFQGNTFSVRTRTRTSIDQNRWQQVPLSTIGWEPKSYAIAGRVRMNAFGSANVVDTGDNAKFGNVHPQGIRFGRVDLAFRNNTRQDTGNLCGYAYPNANFGGPVIPVFKYSRNNFRFISARPLDNKISSFRWFNGNTCRGVIFADAIPPNHFNGNVNNERLFIRKNVNKPTLAGANNADMNDQTSWIQEDPCDSRLDNTANASKAQIRTQITNLFRQVARSGGRTTMDGVCDISAAQKANAARSRCQLWRRAVAGSCAIGGIAVLNALSASVGGPSFSSGDFTNLANARTPLLRIMNAPQLTWVQKSGLLGISISLLSTASVLIDSMHCDDVRLSILQAHNATCT